MKNTTSTTSILTLLGLMIFMAWLPGCQVFLPQAEKDDIRQPSGEPLATSQPSGSAFQRLEVRLTGDFMNTPYDGKTRITGYGEAVGASGDTLVVGASDWNAASGSQKGVAYIYVHDGSDWVEHLQLQASNRDDGVQYDQRFGHVVAIDEDTIVVGAPGSDHPTAGDNTGAVFIFKRNGEAWEEVAILYAPEPTAHAEFGRVLTITGDTILVSNGYQSAGLYVFERVNGSWSAGMRLDQEAGLAEEWFVIALALNENWLAASFVRRTNQPGDNQESKLLLFKRSNGTWALSAEIPPEQEFPEKAWGFGSSLAMDEETLVVGASGLWEAGIQSGGAYIYSRLDDRWLLQDLLVPAVGGFWTGAGSAVDVEGDLLVIGAGGDSEGGFWMGSAFVYQHQEGVWVEQAYLTGQGPYTHGGEFGSDVSISGNTILIGSPHEFGYKVFIYEAGNP
jgi:hypothetical protein